MHDVVKVKKIIALFAFIARDTAPIEAGRKVSQDTSPQIGRFLRTLSNVSN